MLYLRLALIGFLLALGLSLPLGGQDILTRGGSELPGTCGPGNLFLLNTGEAHICRTTDTWVKLLPEDEDQTGSGPGGLPSGATFLILTGTCPTDTTEVAGLSGVMLLGTTAAAGNVGGTGGSDDITPTGTVSQPSFTGNAFTAVINHTHTVTVTDPGHDHVENQNSATTGGLTGWGARDTSTNTSSATSYSTASSTTGITASTANPAEGVANIMPTGTVSTPIFSGVEFDNRPAFQRVIFCEVD